VLTLKKLQQKSFLSELIDSLGEIYEPKKTKTISFRVSEDEYRKLMDLCAAMEIKPSKLIRNLLNTQLKVWEK
jgi:hypothetical protein